jgi:hypothetical protein
VGEQDLKRGARAPKKPYGPLRNGRRDLEHPPMPAFGHSAATSFETPETRQRWEAP